MALPLLTVLLPLFSALLVITGGPASFHRRARLAAWPIGVAFLAAVATLVRVAAEGPLRLEFAGAEGGSLLALPFGMYVDRLAALMMVVVTGVGTIIYAYSVRSMYQDQFERRFLALVAFTIAVMVCLVSSSNLLMMFVFWQCLSFLLAVLANNHVHPQTLQGSFRTFTLLRLGDVAFLAGIILARQVYGTLDIPLLLERAVATPVLLEPLTGWRISAATAVTLLLLVGGMTKSAQFPLHIWLPRQLYAPTPVTALLHAGIINMAGFLINRLAPLYGLSSTALHVAFGVGLVTTLVGASMMLVQSDIKRTLGFSTVGQMGYMLMECGLGAFSLAVFHLVAHGLFKATLFLSCGSLINQAREEPVFPDTPRLPPPRPASWGVWLLGLVTTLVIPLVIILVTHELLHVPLLESQGNVIFLFFIWLTASQALTTLARVQAISSLSGLVGLLVALTVAAFAYLWAVEAFTRFLYPDHGEVLRYFAAAALPKGVFDLLVVAAAVLVAVRWHYLFRLAQGRPIAIPQAAAEGLRRLWVTLANGFYVDEAWQRAGNVIMRAARRIDAWGDHA
jgi:NADH-quinone oxidoreductase subunit L